MVPWASAPRTEEHGQSRINWSCWHHLPLLPPICSEQVPDAIKSQYQFPPPLIAPAAIRDGELICNGIPEESQMHLLNSEHLATQAEQQEVSEGRAGIPNLIFHPTAAVMEIASVSFPSPSSTTPPTPTLTPKSCIFQGEPLAQILRQVRELQSQLVCFSPSVSQCTMRWAKLSCRKTSVDP